METLINDSEWKWVEAPWAAAVRGGKEIAVFEQAEYTVVLTGGCKRLRCNTTPIGGGVVAFIPRQLCFILVRAAEMRSPSADAKTKRLLVYAFEETLEDGFHLNSVAPENWKKGLALLSSVTRSTFVGQCIKNVQPGEVKAVEIIGKEFFERYSELSESP